jgi:hypothetical protein
MKIFFKVIALVLFAQMFASLASAACTCTGRMIPDPIPSECGPCVATAGCTWDGATACPSLESGSTANLRNPISANSVPELVGNIINVALSIVGSLALIIFIYGGFTWMLAAGNESAVEKGKNILTWATIGLVVIFASYSLVNFIINKAIVGGAV